MQSLVILAQLALLLLVLSFEQVYGLPILFMFLTLYYSQFYSDLMKVFLLTAAGLLIGGFYQLPFGLSIGVVVITHLIFQLSGKRFHQLPVRLLISGAFGGGLALIVTRQTLTLPLFISTVISLLIAYTLGRWLFTTKATSTFPRSLFKTI